MAEGQENSHPGEMNPADQESHFSKWEAQKSHSLMTAPNREAVEAAARELAKWDWDIPETHVRDALTAAMPFLAPQPSGSDEERALWLAEELSNIGGDPHIPNWLPVILSVLAAVRAEATLAGAVAEREACAKVAETYVHNFNGSVRSGIAAAIRARRSTP